MNHSTSQEAQFEPLPTATTDSGRPRHIGFELEIAQLHPQQITEAISTVSGGTIEHQSAFLSRVVGTTLGDFNVELDASLLRDRRYQKTLSEMGLDIGEGDARDNLEHWLAEIAGLMVPREIVAPPITWDKLVVLDEIRRNLREAGAQGTHASPLYAFGLQINIESASLKADGILAILRAFLLSYEWLLERSDVDLARRISPYVHAFPEDYTVHVLNPDYRPGIQELIDDYLHYTPTRNRPLDLLPLFTFIDEARVMRAPVEHELIKPRPAFHYRLPNCLIDEPGWSLAVPWNDWVAVEKLAAQPRDLKQLCLSRLRDSSEAKQWLSSVIRKLRS